MNLYRVILFLFLTNCTGFDSGALQIIERSKAEPPYWVQKKPLTLVDDDRRYTFIELKSHFRDLPLGIKETQLSALTASELALKNKLMGSIQQVSKAQLLALKNKSAFTSLVEKNVHASHAKNAAVADIYYEKIIDKQAPELMQYYRIYVKIDFFKEHYRLLLINLANDLKKSRKSDLRSLGKTLGGGIAQPLGH